MQKQDKSKKILIFGKGQIGTMYHEYFLTKNYSSHISSADVTQKEMVEKEIVTYEPDIVINTAGKTNLEWCELNKLQAFNVNVLGANNLSDICQEREIFFIHLSSGCIFESKSPTDLKKENDKPEPAAYYSWTKVWAENMIISHKTLRSLILRPRQPVSSQISEKNMLIKMLTFSKFVGEEGGWNSGTVLEDMMEITTELIEKELTGIFHIANEGFTTPYQIALLLKKYINPNMNIEKITHKDLDKMTPTKRVATVLDISKLQSVGINPQNYEKRLEEIIIRLKKNLLQNPKAADIINKTETTSKERTITSDDWHNIFKTS